MAAASAEVQLPIPDENAGENVVSGNDDKILEKKEHGEMIELKRKIRTWKLNIKEPNKPFHGYYLFSENKESLFPIGPIPWWLLEDEVRLMEIFFLLAERGASDNFFHLFKNSQIQDYPVDILAMSKKQKPDYFKVCGRLLLIAALECSMYELVKWLLIEQSLSPLFELGGALGANTTPLHALLKVNLTAPSESLRHPVMDEKQLLEVLMLLLGKGCKVNECDSNSEYPLVIAARELGYRRLPLSIFLQLLQLGSSPYNFSSANDGHPLRFLYFYRHNTAIEHLLYHGAGLIQANLRLPPPNQVDIAEIGKPVISADMLRKEIVFNHVLTKHWIFSVKELSEMLQSFNEFPVEALKQIDQIYQWIMEAEARGLKLFAEGVVEAFAHYHKSYRESKRQLLTQSGNCLKGVLNKNTSLLVFQYLEYNPHVLEEASIEVFDTLDNTPFAKSGGAAPNLS